MPKEREITKLAPEIVFAFGISDTVDWSEPRDTWDWISHMFLLVEGKIFFGEILVALAHDASELETFKRNIEWFCDHIQHGLEYRENPRSLSSVNKINGREMVQLVASMTPQERCVTAEWARRAYNELMADFFINERMLDILERLRSWLLATD